MNNVYGLHIPIVQMYIVHVYLKTGFPELIKLYILMLNWFKVYVKIEMKILQFVILYWCDKLDFVIFSVNMKSFEYKHPRFLNSLL